jgi:hypothetical protein
VTWSNRCNAGQDRCGTDDTEDADQMNEMSYAVALDAGLEPLSYRNGALKSLGEGRFSGTLDGMVWSKRQPCLMALLPLE